MEIERFLRLDVIVICGLPGAGKSHFARTCFKDRDFMRINRTEIRRHLYEMAHFGDEWHTENYNDRHENLVKHVERKIFEHFLQNKEKILIDNTNVSVSARKIYVQACKQMNKSIGAVFINTPIQKCLERNHMKKDYIPDNIISNLYAEIEYPTREEGFNEVLLIKGH